MDTTDTFEAERAAARAERGTVLAANRHAKEVRAGEAASAIALAGPGPIDVGQLADLARTSRRWIAFDFATCTEPEWHYFAPTQLRAVLAELRRNARMRGAVVTLTTPGLALHWTTGGVLLRAVRATYESRSSVSLDGKLVEREDILTVAFARQEVAAKAA